GDELIDEGLVDLLLYEEPRGRYANLTSIAVFRSREQFGCFVRIRIVKHDCRAVATEFHGRALHVLAGHGSKLLSYGRRARDRDLADDRMRDEVFRDFGGNSVNEVDDTSRHARIGEATNKLGRRCWCFLWSFDDDGAAGCQGTGDLAHGLVDRKVPG